MDLRLESLPKLKPEIKTRWVEALRSGKYMQTQGTLRNGEGFCCLGVLCDIVKNDLNIEWEYEKFENGADLWSFDHEDGIIPGSVFRYVVATGQKTAAIELADPLATRNDGSFEFDSPWTFVQIADAIEEHA